MTDPTCGSCNRAPRVDVSVDVFIEMMPGHGGEPWWLCAGCHGGVKAGAVKPTLSLVPATREASKRTTTATPNTQRSLPT